MELPPQPPMPGLAPPDLQKFVPEELLLKKQDVIKQPADKADAKGPQLTGGRVNYYLVSVPHPQREDQPAYQAECEDIIEALQLNPDEANIFKEIWRSANARLNNGKQGHSAVYGAEKIVHYAGRILRRLRRNVSDETVNRRAT